MGEGFWAGAKTTVLNIDGVYLSFVTPGRSGAKDIPRIDQIS
jgi:alpha-acetolactate decarboxylase